MSSGRRTIVENIRVRGFRRLLAYRVRPTRSPTSVFGRNDSDDATVFPIFSSNGRLLCVDVSSADSRFSRRFTGVETCYATTVGHDGTFAIKVSFTSCITFGPIFNFQKIKNKNTRILFFLLLRRIRYRLRNKN